jgi:hypothetical protein
MKNWLLLTGHLRGFPNTRDNWLSFIEMHNFKPILITWDKDCRKEEEFDHDHQEGLTGVVPVNDNSFPVLNDAIVNFPNPTVVIVNYEQVVGEIEAKANKVLSIRASKYKRPVKNFDLLIHKINRIQANLSQQFLWNVGLNLLRTFEAKSDDIVFWSRFDFDVNPLLPLIIDNELNTPAWPATHAQPDWEAEYAFGLSALWAYGPLEKMQYHLNCYANFNKMLRWAQRNDFTKMLDSHQNIGLNLVLNNVQHVKLDAQWGKFN